MELDETIELMTSKNYKDRKVKATKSSVIPINDEACRLKAERRG